MSDLQDLLDLLIKIPADVPPIFWYTFILRNHKHRGVQFQLFQLFSINRTWKKTRGKHQWIRVDHGVFSACGTVANRWRIEDIGGHSFSLHFRFDDLHFGALVKVDRNLEPEAKGKLRPHGSMVMGISMLIWGMVLQF